MLSQDKCLPIAYKCLSFTVLFVLERHCAFKMLFIHYLETVSPGLAYLQPHPRKPELPPSAQACLPTAGHRHREAMPWEAWLGSIPSLHGVPVGCPVDADTCPLFWLPARKLSLSGPGPVMLDGHYFRSQGVAPVKPPQGYRETRGHSKPEAREPNLSVPLYRFRN